MKDRRGIYLMVMTVGLLISCGSSSDSEESTKVTPEEPIAKIEQTMIDPASISEGQKLFILCAACHNLKEGEPHKVGPNLAGVFNSPAAKKEGFGYSEALSSSGIVWTPETMRDWITNPAEMVPTTSMAFIGIQDKEKQDILIEYLLEETKL